MVDCDGESIEVHRVPTAEGYREVIRLTDDAAVNPGAFPDVRLTLREIFA